MLLYPHFPPAGDIFEFGGNVHPHLMGQPVYLWSQEFDTSLGCTVKCLTLLWFQGIPFMDAVVSPFPRFAGEIFTFGGKSHPHLMERPVQLRTQGFDTSLGCFIRCLALLWLQGIPSMEAVV